MGLFAVSNILEHVQAPFLKQVNIDIMCQFFLFPHEDQASAFIGLKVPVAIGAMVFK